jgi:fatty acid desaturase
MSEDSTQPVASLSPFAQSWKDSFLIILGLLYPAMTVFGLLMFQVWPWPAMVALGLFMVFLNCTNYQCVAHNFLHNPFFRSRFANALFSIINSVSLGLPQTLYKYHHLNHHRFNNDLPVGSDQPPNDWSSTYRYGRPRGSEESIWRYALLGPLRTDLVGLYREAARKRQTTLVWWEAAAMTAYTVGLFVADWQYTLVFVIPVWYLGQSAALAENFLEHHHAVPGNRMTDSVSCYGRLYNFLWFNNGYHQEHHCKPQVHWTRIPEVRGEMLPEDQRRVVRVAHWFNF